MKLIKIYEIFKSNINNHKNLIRSTKFILFINSNHLRLFRTQNEFGIARNEIQIHQNELSRLRQQLTQTEQIQLQLQNEFEQTKHQCREYEQQISVKDELKRNVDLLIDQYRQQLTNEKELRISKNNFHDLINLIIFDFS